MKRSSTFGSLRARPPFSGDRQRIGLMGGSFNPPHAAHAAIAETAQKRLKLDQVWWIVTPGNPLKSPTVLAPVDRRMALVNAVIRNKQNKVTAFERHLPTPFTASTIAFLRRRKPNAQFVWIMGADGLRDFAKWRQWRQIFATVPIAVVDRPGYRLKSLAGKPAHAFRSRQVPEIAAAMVPEMRPPAWTFLTARLSPLSSTALRARV